MNIVILASEAVPFAKTGGLADVVTALGKELVILGHQVTVMLPRYGSVSVTPTHVQSPLTLSFAGRHITYALIETYMDGVKFVFVEAPGYFDRPQLYGDSKGDYGDNDERFLFFNRACLNYFRYQDPPDVFHCNDWQTGLVPLLLRTHYIYEAFSRSPVVFTIHNMAYQGVFPAEHFGLLEIGPEYMGPKHLEFFGRMNFLKSGIIYSDLITTVSRRYSFEIQTAEFAYGLEGALGARRERLFGILNGIDEDVWNPSIDPLIPQNYSVDDLQGKARCRRELMQMCGWDPSSNWPVLAIISRLASQKGFDLLERSIERILGMHFFLVVLGTGEQRYERLFRQWSASRPQQVAAALRFDNKLAHQIEAGADMFLMPSRYEPCGLNQMYSLKYGTVPVVRATGGLDDTVDEWNSFSGSGNGFKFYDYNPDAMMDALGRARNAYEYKEGWVRLMQNGMRASYSWRNSAVQYLQIYEQAYDLKQYSM